MTTPTKNEQNTSLFWSDEKLKEMRTDFEIHVKSISNMIQWALTLGEHESEEFRNELKAISQRTEPALKEVLFIGSNFLSIFDAKFVAARSGNNSGSGGLVYNGVKQIILSTKDFLDDPRNIVPVIKNLVNDLQDSFLKFVNAVKNWATIQAELSNVLKKGSASIKNFIRNKGFSNLVDTAIAKGFSNFLDPKLIAGNSRSKLFNLAVAIITGAGFGNTDGVVSDPQSTQKTIIQNILGAVFGIVGGGALATLFMPAAAGTVATITIGVLAGIVADFVWEYAVPKSWKQLGTDVLSDIYDHVVAHRTILIKGVESLFPGPTFIIEEVTDSVITYFIEDDRIERKLPVPVAKHQGDKLDILKPVSKDKYKSLFEQVIDTGKIRTLIVNGETFTIDDAVSSIIIRNNLDKIAPETFVTSHILIKPGEKLQLGNGKDYYEVKANDTIASIAKSNHMMVKELVTLNPWLADDNRIKFYQNKLILPNETSLATDTHTSHEYGDEGTRNTVAHSNKASSHNNSNHAFTAADTSAHDYFADFDGGDDKFYGSLKGGDTFAGGKGNDIYYINFNGERSDTIIDEGKNELHVIDEKGNVVRLTGGSRNKDTMPERTFVSDDGHYVFHVDEHNMLSVLRAEDVKKAGNGDLSEGMTKIIANKKTKHHASKKQPAGGYANNPGSSNAGAGNAGGNHSNTGNSGSNHSDSGKNQAGNPSAVPEPKEIRVPNFGNGGFGINLKDDPQEPDPFPSVPEPAPDSAPGYGDAPRTSSPIIFDLNGDGVTTVAKDSDIIRFDLDNNGFAERTGWVNKYDGLLVRDLNGNGRIDNGGELFGNYTKLANGQMAANGFEALNDLDDNHDGQITAADTAWKTLRIWQDSNQDAHSAKGELSTLDELGITSISTKYQNSTEIDTAGNAHKQISSARRSDGSSIAVSDVWFTTHLADTSQKNKKAVSSEIALLPNIRSFGNVPDLHQAMIVNQKLKQAVETYLASNKKQRTAQIDSLIYLWTGVAGVPANSRGIYIDGRQLAALEALTGEPFLQLGRNPNPNHGGGPILAAEYNKFAHYVAAHLDAYGNPLFIRYHDREAGREIYNFNKLNSYIQMLILDNKLDEIANIGQIIQGLIAYDSYQKDLWQKNVHKFILSDYRWAYLITSSYTEGTKSADTLHGKVSNEFINGDEGDDKLYGYYGDDALNGGAGNDDLFGEDGNDTLIGGAGNDYLDGGSGSDTYVFGKGFGQDTVNNYDLSAGRKDIIRFTDGITADMLTFTREGNHLLIKAKDGSGQVTVQSYFENDGSGAYRIDEIHFDNGKVLDVATIKKLVQQSTDSSDNLYAYQSGSTLNGGLGDDYLYGANGADTLNGGKGNDWLYSGNGNDMLNGDEGDDKLYGYYGDDALNGGAGNDDLFGEDGNDTLIGGAGNDYLDGGSGSDTYVFGKGFGQDTVNNYDLSAGRKDIIRFTDGITADMLTFTREGNHLLIKAKDGSGQVTVQSYFENDGSGAYRIDEIHFDNGKVLDVATIKKLVQQSTDSSDNLYAYQSGSTLNGGLGDDYLYGANGADTLNGGKGNDWLYSGNGNDMLNGDEGDDKLYGYYGDDALNGGAGNDDLFGEDGNDTLIGGAGNDYLDGGSGSDTYVFGKGFGQDTVNNYDLSAGRKDIIRFTDGITADMLTFTREGNHLLIKAKDGSGQVTVQSYFENDGSGAYRIDEIHFDNGKVLDVATIKKLVQQSTDSSDNLYAYQSGSTLNGGLGDDYLYGANGADTLNGGKGNDWLYSGNGNDMLNGDEGDDKLYGYYGDDALNGGAGNDDLFGEDGNDTLIGGAGNDYLDGGSGSDTYVFGKGFGQDTVHNYHVDKNSDTMHFKGFKAADVHFIRSGSDLVLSTSEQDNVRISGFFYGENYRVDTFVFDDAAISNPDFAKYINAGNNLVQSMSVFGSKTAAAGGNVDANTQSVQQPLLVTPSA